MQNDYIGILSIYYILCIVASLETQVLHPLTCIDPVCTEKMLCIVGEDTIGFLKISVMQYDDPPIFRPFVTD